MGNDKRAKRAGDISGAETDDKTFSARLTQLLGVGNRLAIAPSVDELCRQAVQAGLTQLGFERASIWLVDRDHQMILGTFGTDEDGNIRDERGQSHPWGDHMDELGLLDSPQRLFKRQQVPLYSDAHEIVGMGDVGAAALWNGEAVTGMLYMDNLLTRQPISEDQWRIFELFASTLGHLLSLKSTESALRANEELLSQILDIMPVGVFVLSAQEQIAHYNRAAQEIWEFDPEHLAEWSPRAFWVRDQRPVGKDEWAGRQALWYGESILNQEVEILRSDGARRVLLNSGVPLRDSSGAVNGSVIVNQDITESKRREQQLEALEQMGRVLRPLTGRRGTLAALVNYLLQLPLVSGVAVVLSDKVSDKEERIIFEAAAGNYAPLAGTIVPEELARSEAGSETAIHVFTAEENVANCLFKALHSNPPYAVVAPLIAENAPIGALVLGYTEAPDRYALALIRALADVAAAAIQRGQLYDEVTTQAYRLERVMESVNFGLIMLDPQRRVVLANQRAQSELAHVCDIAVGEELKDIGGQPLRTFLTPRNNYLHAHEVSLDGAFFDVTAAPVGASGAVGGWLIIIHDVTQERAIQSSIQQHQRLAAVGQLAAGIAHDFNNIVAVIMLYVQMLQRNPLLQEIDRSRLFVIREQAQYASKLIRQILDFSRQTVIERQPTDLKELIAKSVTLWERTLPEHISIRFVADVEDAAQILAEESSVQQALTNLAVNARDAMPQGGALEISLHELMVSEEEPPPITGMKYGRWFEVGVKDSGTGIAPEVLPHIFDPFFTTKELGKGTGLGLAQVYGIVQQHGGMVAAQSEIGNGTTITLFLPALHSEAMQSPDGDSHEADGEGSETILLVEDNQAARDATTALLEMLGYRVVSAADGRAGLELFRRHRDSIQLVLTDLVMPEMGGMALLQQIQSENPNVHLLMMTGYPLEVESYQFPGGPVEWLQKPFTVKQLTEAVRQILDRDQTSR